MVFKGLIAATAAAALMAAPAAAQSTQAPIERAAPALQDESELGRGGFLIPLLALGAVILGILVLLDDDDEGPISA